MFMNCLTKPIDSGVPSYGFMLWVDHNNFKKLVCRVLSNPVRVQDAKTSTITPSTFLERVDTMTLISSELK